MPHHKSEDVMYTSSRRASGTVVNLNCLLDRLVLYILSPFYILVKSLFAIWHLNKWYCSLYNDHYNSVAGEMKASNQYAYSEY